MLEQVFRHGVRLARGGARGSVAGLIVCFVFVRLCSGRGGRQWRRHYGAHPQVYCFAKMRTVLPVSELLYVVLAVLRRASCFLPCKTRCVPGLLSASAERSFCGPSFACGTRVGVGWGEYCANVVKSWCRSMACLLCRSRYLLTASKD